MLSLLNFFLDIPRTKFYIGFATSGVQTARGDLEPRTKGPQIMGQLTQKLKEHEHWRKSGFSGGEDLF